MKNKIKVKVEARDKFELEEKMERLINSREAEGDKFLYVKSRDDGGWGFLYWFFSVLLIPFFGIGLILMIWAWTHKNWAKAVLIFKKEK